jgi:predicted RNA-binding Zn-ribbon protein involved in translation (DUF1610 family)
MTPASMPLLTISGRGKGTGAAASAGRGEGAGTAARGGCRTGAAANVQQWLVPSQIRCALGNLACASPSVMQAGEPYASDDPIMIATARMGITRAVIAITLPKKRSPGHLRPGPISTSVSAVLFGDKRPPCLTRALQVSERERCTTARCPECDGKQEILRSSEFFRVFHRTRAGTNLTPEQTTGTLLLIAPATSSHCQRPPRLTLTRLVA